MIGDDKLQLPPSVGGLFVTAARLYARRLEFYLALAVLAFAVEYCIDAFVLQDSGFAAGLDVVIGSFVTAAVSIGVAYDLAGKDADWSRIFTAASLRWGVVTIVQFVAFFMTWLFNEALVPTPDVSLSERIFALPIIILWGAVELATVPAAIEPVTSRLLLPLLALGKALAVSTRVANLARLMLFSLILTILFLCEIYLIGTLDARHVSMSAFWGSVPLEMLTLGPLQALATVFYVDFLRRAGR